MSSESKENFHQLSGLVLDVGTYVLQKVFKKQYDHCKLEQYLKSNQRKLDKLRDRCILQQKHVEILNPPEGQKPKLKEMDITLLYILLRYLGTIMMPHNGWESPVSENDKTTGGDILRLKYMRHDLYEYRHQKTLTTENFFRHWKVTFDAVFRLAVRLDKKHMLYIAEQIKRIVTEAVVEDRGERECNLCVMLRSGFKDDLKETVVCLQKKCSSDNSNMRKLEELDKNLKDAHANDNLFWIGEELCSLERTLERQMNEKESTPETPKKSLPLKEELSASLNFEELPDVQRGRMDEAHANCIRRNIVRLKKELVCTDILDDMIQERIFADDDIQRIHAGATQKAKNDEFFQFLLNRGPRAFPVFLQSLRKKGYIYLVNGIEETLEQVQRRAPKNQRVVGNVFSEQVQGPGEDDETIQPISNFREDRMALHRTSPGTGEERTTITRVTRTLSDSISSPTKDTPTSNNQIHRTGFLRDVRGVSESPPVGIILPERKAQSSDSSQQDNPVRYGIPEIPDTSPKEVDDALGLDGSSLHVKPVSTHIEGDTMKKTIYGNQESRTIDSSQNSKDAAGFQTCLELGRTVDLPKDFCMKNKNLYPCKTLRNKNFQPGKPLEKSLSCPQISAQKQCLPKECQMEEHFIQATQTVQLEKNYRDPSEWVQYAQKKIDEATSENRLIEDFQTILCLDASDSMTGKGWEEARRLIKDYIAALESLAVDQGIIECVALTIFGAKTDIEQKLTMDLKLILQALENIVPCGPTQLYGGLYMALAAQGGYPPLLQNQVKHCPQIILITDGRATHPKLVTGPDVQNPKEMKEIHSAIIKVVEEIAAKNICINCVPVGEADRYLLGMIASKAKGKVYDHTSGQVLAQRTSNTLHAAYVLQHYELVTIQELSAGGTCPISLEDAVTKEFPDVKKESGFESFSKLLEPKKAQVLAVAKDIIRYNLWEGTVLSLPETQGHEAKGEGHKDSGPEGMSYKFSRDASGDVMKFKENEGTLKVEKVNQWHKVGRHGTDNEIATQKDLDFHLEEKYESKKIWTSIAVMEVNKARQRERGSFDSVICIDTSASMRGEEWTQVKTFYMEFLSGLEDMSVEHHMTDDHVALVVFGSITKVVVELTNDFSSLRQEFGKIKLGGPTPLFGGLLLAFGCLGGSMSKTIKGIPVFSRIILISDGKPTGSTLVSGPDIFDPGSLSEISDELRDLLEKLSSDTVKVHCIPVGDSDDRILQMIADVSKGKLYSFKEGRYLARRTLNATQAGPMLQHWKLSQAAAMVQGNELSLEDFIDQGYQHLELEGAVNISEEDKKGIQDILEEYEELVKKKKLNPEDDIHKEDMRKDLPPLGTRVHSEPVWNPEDESCQGYGTVVGHIPLRKEIYVEWDNGGKVTKCRYGSMMFYDVSSVDYPRILDKDQIIAVGSVVIRGRDWMYGDQDGFSGAHGVVIKVSDDGRVLVRWSDGSKCFYRYSQDNKYDLDIVGELYFRWPDFLGLYFPPQHRLQLLSDLFSRSVWKVLFEPHSHEVGLKTSRKCDKLLPSHPPHPLPPPDVLRI